MKEARHILYIQTTTLLTTVQSFTTAVFTKATLLMTAMFTKATLFMTAVFTTAILLLTACSDDVATGELNTSDDGRGIGQMVVFSSGTTENRETRAGDGVTYYMPHDYRFVCRMYYKAQTGADQFDVSGKTDFTAWLKVSGNLGKSLYWNKAYTDVNSAIKGVGGVDEYGNDYGATAFYWQNRKEHAFLAWTDLNKAKSGTIKGGSAAGTLKFDKDLDYRVYTGDKQEQWVVTGYQIHGIGENFTSLSAMREYVESHYTDDASIEAFNNLQNEIGNAPGYADGWLTMPTNYQFGLSCKHTIHSTDDVQNIDAKHRTYKWYRYVMFFEKVEFPGVVRDYIPEVKDGIIVKLKNDQGEYVAEAEVTNEKNSDGKYVDAEGNVIVDMDKLTYRYYSTDASGLVKYNENNPRYTFYYQRNEENKTVDVYNEFPALKFDLTRGTGAKKKSSMSEQPDIAQAREIQAPVGATQESNRVNLYFKHKFSQIVVNVKNSADNSVTLEARDIKRVELLGVTEEGYIFTELDENGDVRDAAYKEIDFSIYNAMQLKNNPYGTSFEMFELDNPETGYLKSFNAIAFGQLQAIRITWQEQGAGQYEHAAIFRIPNTELVNLKSGYRYIWNIEVRRGTLAIIRTEIVDWELPYDENHNGNIDGTIQN